MIPVAFRHSTPASAGLPALRRTSHAASSRLIRTRLYAAAVSSTCCAIFHRPTCRDLHRPPTVFDQPKNYSTILRLRWLRQ
ncbi:MAG: hypothetical protein RLY72_2676 [Planctomycetota bacterium]